MLYEVITDDFEGLYQTGNLIVPLERDGLKLMSFGWATHGQGGGPAIMRGPMVSQVINQLMTGTNWGQLDYLVIDMPPGTGDIQLTLSQQVPVSGAVVVTTPQDIAAIDARKGLAMFRKVAIPVLGVIENVITSYSIHYTKLYETPRCGRARSVPRSRRRRSTKTTAAEGSGT